MGPRRYTRTRITVIIAALLETSALASGRTNCRFKNISTKVHVERAVAGAIERLESPRCSGLFREFTDASGAPLQDELDRSGRTALDFIETLHFVDGSDTPQCQARSDLAAYTAPGHHVIFVCGNRFVRMLNEQAKAAEMLIIHEVLHAAGLGENPPSQGEITARVTRRCT